MKSQDGEVLIIPESSFLVAAYVIMTYERVKSFCVLFFILCLENKFVPDSDTSGFPAMKYRLSHYVKVY